MSTLQKHEVDRSVAARLRRRILFFGRYLVARAQVRRIERLLLVLEESFRHPWVTRIEVKIQPRPGRGTRWAVRHIGPSGSSERGLVHWDAPVTVCVFRKKRCAERPALCMSLYLSNRAVHVVQLQGVPQTDPPRGVRLWPVKFIEACRDFAIEERLDEVKVAKAETLYSYRNPTVNSELPKAAREETVQRIRRTMELLYDANALSAGFAPDGDWFKWTNSSVMTRLISALPDGSQARRL